MGQILFAACLLVSCLGFALTIRKRLFFFSLTKRERLRDYPGRLNELLRVGFAQSKIFRRPWAGAAHALVFWGFLAILFGSVEMAADGVSGRERSFSGLGSFYDLMTGTGDVFALVVLAAVLFFLARRLFFRIKRFEGAEMRRKSRLDALAALTLIALLMVSLLALNTFHISISGAGFYGTYPVSAALAPLFRPLPRGHLHWLYEASWWSHILLIMIFANLLPYSKHFHIFTSLPNCFAARREPVGKLTTLTEITPEIRAMLDPSGETPPPAIPLERFGVKDVNDARWPYYLSALACTECGRCTDSCPASITGKKLSPRKIFMDFRARMNERGDQLWKHPSRPDDGKSLVGAYVTPEELWACTTCSACAQECPVDIHHPSLIVEMRRYLVMENGSAPGGLKSLFTNIENNGAPWQFSQSDRMLWAKDLKVPLLREQRSKGENPEYLFWVGCAGAFDERAKKVSRALIKILTHCRIDFAVLGEEESCNGDAARRAGNEMLFQMQALKNIELLNSLGVRKILTACPHCFNTFAHEYPDLGGHFKVVHHSQLLAQLIRDGKLNVGGRLRDKLITFHDPCYLGRANNDYHSPRSVLDALGVRQKELRRSKSFALCCGAGGGQMFKEAEQGNKEVFMERMDDVLDSGAAIVATACPFCMTMLTDGIKYCLREDSLQNFDIAELVAQALD